MKPIIAALLLGSVLVGCSRNPEDAAQAARRERNAELAEKIAGVWSNCDKGLVARMEFRPDGSVSYEVGLPQKLQGRWKITEDSRLELTPDPLVVNSPEPNPTGILALEITDKDFIYNGDGPATANKPMGGRFRRKE
jgi:hypothetical protein